MINLVIAAFVGLAVMVGTCEPIQAEPLTVGAPPSLRAPFQEILSLFEEEFHTAVNIVYSPSKTLLRQIEKGARIDVFVSAGVSRASAQEGTHPQRRSSNLGPDVPRPRDVGGFSGCPSVVG